MRYVLFLSLSCPVAFNIALGRMQAIMSGLFHDLKIFYSVVQFVFILMVDNLISFKGAAYRFFHDQPMLSYVAMIGVWMGSHSNETIAPRDNNTAFPSNRFFAYHDSAKHYSVAFFRACKECCFLSCSSVFELIWFSVKRFTADFAGHIFTVFSHNFIMPEAF